MLYLWSSHKQISTTGFLTWSKFRRFFRTGRLHHTLAGKVIPICSSHSRTAFGSNMEWINLRVVRLHADPNAPPKCMYSSLMVTEELHRLTLPMFAKKHHYLSLLRHENHHEAVELLQLFHTTGGQPFSWIIYNRWENCFTTEDKRLGWVWDVYHKEMREGCKILQAISTGAKSSQKINSS